MVDRIDFHSGDDVRPARCCCDCAPMTTPRNWRRCRRPRLSRRSTTTATCGSSGPGGQPGGGRYGQLQPEECARAGRRAAGDAGQEDACVPRSPDISASAPSISGSISIPAPTVVTLQALDPMFVDFSVPQQALDRVAVGQAVTAKVDTYPDQTFPGKIIAINPPVDTDSRNVQMRASLPQPGSSAAARHVRDDRHRGRRARAAHHAAADRDHLQPVWQHGLPGGAERRTERRPALVARQSFVTTGATRGDQVAVLSGVKPGDVVVSAGQIKLHNGVARRRSTTAVQTADNPHPVPTDR